jgi:hypothetical protein
MNLLELASKGDIMLAHLGAAVASVFSGFRFVPGAQARLLRRHQELLLNWFRARRTISSGPTEGLNDRLKLTLRKAYGFQTFHAAEVALYHSLGTLPEPQCTHRFC